MFAALAGAVAALYDLKRHEKKLEAELALAERDLARQRTLAELDRERKLVGTQIESFMVKLQCDPISALNLRFMDGDGFASDPFEFKGKILSGSTLTSRAPVSQVSGIPQNIKRVAPP